LNRSWNFVRRFSRDRRGNVAVLFAVSLPVLVGFVGLGVESGYWFFENRRLQAAADLAAYAGAVAARAKEEAATIVSSAQTEAEEHGFDPAAGTIQVNWPPTSGSNINNRSVEVILQQTYERYFSAVFADEPVFMAMRAVATFEEPNSACVIALNEVQKAALQISGFAKPSFRACSLMANSIADDAVSIQGSAEVTTSCVSSSGGVYNTATLVMEKCPEPRLYMPRADDPFAGVPPPAIPAKCETISGPGGKKGGGKKDDGGDTIVLGPGNYCGGFSVTGSATLGSGVYVISGGTMQFNANASISGSGVTFYLTDGARVIMNGSADIELSAPTSGPYKGMLFYADPDSSTSYGIFNGTADSSLKGALYFPTQNVAIRGDFGGSGGCTRLVAGTIEINGNPTFDADCTAAGIDDFGVPGGVFLVE